jgi:hypothetical protein
MSADFEPVYDFGLHTEGEVFIENTSLDPNFTRLEIDLQDGLFARISGTFYVAYNNGDLVCSATSYADLAKAFEKGGYTGNYLWQKITNGERDDTPNEVTSVCRPKQII